MLKEHNNLVALIDEFNANAGKGVVLDTLADRLALSVSVAKTEIEEFGGEAYDSYADALSLFDAEAPGYDVFIHPYEKAVSEAEALLAAHH